MALRRNILITLGTSGAIYFFQFLTTIVASRLLSPEQVGIFAVSMAVVAILQGLREFGIVSYIVQERDLTDEKIRTVFATALVVAWGLGLAVFLGRNVAAGFFGNAGISNVLLVLSLTFIIFPFGLPATAMLRRERRFADLAVISTASSFVSFVVTCALAASGHGAISLALGTLAGGIVLAGTALYFWPQHLLLYPSFKSWKIIFAYGAQSSLATLIETLGQASPDLIIGKLFGLHEVAIFTRGRVLTRIVERLTIAPVQTATLPEIANRMRMGEDVRPTLLQVNQVTLLVSWSLLAFIFANADDVIFLLYGSQWSASAQILRAFCAGQAILQLTSIPRLYLQATGDVRKILFNEIAVLLILSSAVIFGSRWSLETLSWLLIVPSLATVILYWRSITNYIDIGELPIYPNLRFPLIVALSVLASQTAIISIARGLMDDRLLTGVLVSLLLNSTLAAITALVQIRFFHFGLYSMFIRNLRMCILRGKRV